jgi:hypothetical protein
MQENFMVKVPTPSPGGPGLAAWWVVTLFSTVFSLEDVLLRGNWSNMLHLLTTADGKVLVVVGGVIGAVATHFFKRPR